MTCFQSSLFAAGVFSFKYITLKINQIDGAKRKSSISVICRGTGGAQSGLWSDDISKTSKS